MVSPPRTARRPASRQSLADDLRKLGVQAGGVLLVHASLRSLGWVADGAATVVAALSDTVGGHGTVVVPTGTAGNSDTSRLYARRTAGMTSEQIRQYQARMPPFDPGRTPSEGMGRVSEAVRTDPAAVRSAHPQTSFAALGPDARELMDDHAPDCHLGERSPLARLYEAGAWVLLLGVGYGTCSAFHLAEYRYTPDPPRRSYRCVVSIGGQPAWWQYEDVVLDDRLLETIGAEFDRTGQVRSGRVGQASCRLLPLAPAVDFAAQWLRRHRIPASGRTS